MLSFLGLGQRAITKPALDGNSNGMFLCPDCKSCVRILAHDQKHVTNATLWRQSRTVGSFYERVHCPLCRLVQRTMEEHLATLAPNIKNRFKNSDVLVIHSPDDVGVLELHDASADVPFVICEIDIHLEGSWTPPQTIDVSAIRKWIQECELGFGKHTAVESSHNPTEIILIDVNHSNLVRATTASRYAALSYVWGGIDMLSTVSTNLSTLLQPGSLTSDMTSIPGSIQDAIDFTRSLDIQYLWVDTMCIIQDDQEHKHNQIEAMHQVYSQALVTLVAASGHDANAGLCGVRKGSRTDIVEQALLENQQGCLAVSLTAQPPSLKDVLRLSTYDSRGWTYQERLLSKRCLFFTKWQAFLHCHHEAAREDGATTIQGHKLTELVNPLAGILVNSSDHGYHSKALECYCSLVQNLSSRHLTYEADILNAFLGIAEYFRQNIKEEFLSGLPISFFDYALLWYPVDFRSGLQRRRKRTTKVYFPSWSWAGWTGAVRLPSPAQYARLIPMIERVAIGWPDLMGTLELVQNQAYMRVLRPVDSAPLIKPPPEDISSCTLQFEAWSVPSVLFRCSGAHGWSPSEHLPLHVRQQRVTPQFRRKSAGVMVQSPEGAIHMGYDQMHPRQEWYPCGALRFSVKGDGTLFSDQEEDLPHGYLIALSHTPYRVSGAYWQTYLLTDMINVILIQEDGDFAERLAVGQIEADIWNKLAPQKRKVNLR